MHVRSRECPKGWPVIMQMREDGCHLELALPRQRAATFESVCLSGPPCIAVTRTVEPPGVCSDPWLALSLFLFFFLNAVPWRFLLDNICGHQWDFGKVSILLAFCVAACWDSREYRFLFRLDTQGNFWRTSASDSPATVYHGGSPDALDLCYSSAWSISAVHAVFSVWSL